MKIYRIVVSGAATLLSTLPAAYAQISQQLGTNAIPSKIQVQSALKATVASSRRASKPDSSMLLKHGLELTARNDLVGAEACIRQAISENQGEALAHYYLANLLAKTHRHAEAIYEYSTSYSIDPFGTSSGYCRQALLAYKAPIPRAEPAHSASESVLTASSRIAPVYRQSSGAAPVLSSLHGQMEKEKKQRSLEAEQQASYAMRDTEAEVSKIRENLAAEIYSIQHPTRLETQIYYRRNPEVPEAAVKQAQQKAEDDIALARALASTKSSVYKQHSKELEKNLEETASNLETQMAVKPLPGSAHLIDKGTGLFVRNYSADPGPPPEVHRGVARIIKRTPLERTMSDEDDQEEQKVSTVRGAVLK